MVRKVPLADHPIAGLTCAIAMLTRVAVRRFPATRDGVAGFRCSWLEQRQRSRLAASGDEAGPRPQQPMLAAFRGSV